jgi:PAS domain S-box-containing protein
MRLADWQNTPFTVPLLLIGLLCSWSAYIGWRRRVFPGAVPFAVLMAALAAWAFVNLVEKSLVNHDLRRAVSIFVYVFIVTVPAAWLVFAARFSRPGRWTSRRVVALLFVEPVLVLGVAFTNSWHGLLRTSTEMRTNGPWAIMVITQGPFFYLNAVYTHLLFAAGAVLLLTGVARRPGGTVGRFALVLGAMLVPVLGNVAYAYHLQPAWLTDLTPVYFAVPGLAAAWLLFRVRVFDVLPIARDFVLDCLGDAVFVLDARLRILDANPAARSLLPGPPGARQQPLAEAFPELSRYLQLRDCGSGGTTEIRLCWAGAERFWDVHVLPLAGPQITNGVTVGVLVRLVEVTDRKRAEAARQESELRFRAIFDETFEFVCLLGPGGKVVEVNRPALEFRRLRASDVVGAPLWETAWMDVSPEVRARVRSAVAAAAGGQFVRDEVPLRDAEGGLRTFDLSLKPVRNEDGALVFLIAEARDITERKRLEEQFRQAQKMESIGRLAGGVAHDFNNLLTVINGYSELLLRQPRLEEGARELLREVQQAGERAARLTGQLLAFGRKSILQPRVLDLNAVLGNLEKMLRRLIGEDVELAVLPGAGLELVRADPGQIEQVLINLAVNARDAMPRGGTLTVETGNAFLNEGYAAAHPGVKPGPYVLLAVKDTGCGMDQQVQAHLFEPFFTTKGVGQGTGLGLATVYGTVKQSEGHVEVRSEVGVGTTFKVYLPAVQAEAPAGKPHPGWGRMPAGRETVLLVEDEEGVRALGREVLKKCGYTVLEAGNGDEALAVAARQPGPIHLLLTDVVMPRLGGRELAERLGAARPEIKVLYMSGYTDDAVIRHGCVEAEQALMQKPFSPTALATKVREVLDKKA